MKKIMFLLAFLPMFVFTACSDDDEKGGKTYSFEYLIDDNEITVDAVIFEYSSDGEKIGSNYVSNCKKGTSKSFAANSMAEKVKVYFTMKYGSVKQYKWVQNVFYLKDKGNTEIKIVNETIVGAKEP